VRYATGRAQLFALGDVVELKCGGQKMVIVGPGTCAEFPSHYEVTWFDGSRLQTDEIVAEALQTARDAIPF
jgi:uncharacterized protein YodC (DUF2158 family)